MNTNDLLDIQDRLHEATKVQSGVRQVMVVNVWHKDCPPTALETGDFFTNDIRYRRGQ
jgi:hypothetical protein